VVKKQITFFLLLAACLSEPAFSEDTEKRMSIQAGPLPYIADIVFLFMDNDIKTFVIGTDVEFQYAINRYFNVSITNTLYFENYLDSYLQDSGGRYDEDYGKQFQCMFTPAFLYRPLGTWLRGWYISGFPIIGWTHIATKNLSDNFVHAGLGLSSGYQWILKNGFTIQLGGGISKTWIIPFKSNKGEFEEWHLFNVPVDFLLTFRLGYTF
jgi:hypothetical protein